MSLTTPGLITELCFHRLAVNFFFEAPLRNGLQAINDSRVKFLMQAAGTRHSSLEFYFLHMQPLQIAIEAMFISVDLLPLKINARERNK